MRKRLVEKSTACIMCYIDCRVMAFAQPERSGPRPKNSMSFWRSILERRRAAMGIQHLTGKRTGRPRGTKNTPPWVRDARWAYQNLGNLDAAPPSPLAGRLLDLGREQPDRLAVCLAAIDAHMGGPKPSLSDAAAVFSPGARSPKEQRLFEGKSSRLKMFDLPESALLDLVRAGDGKNGIDTPDDVHVCGCKLLSKRRKVRLIFRSMDFPRLKKDDHIPELK